MEKFYPFKSEDSKLLVSYSFKIEMHPNTEAFATKKNKDLTEYMICLNEDESFSVSYSEDWMDEPEVRTFKTVLDCILWLGLS